MEPLLDYYLLTIEGEVELWAAAGEDVEALPGCESVQKIPFWQALQWDAALREMQRSCAPDLDLFPLAAFMGASDDIIAELLGELEGV